MNTVGRGGREPAEPAVAVTVGQVVRKAGRTGFRLRHGVFVMASAAYRVAPDSPRAGLLVATALGAWSLCRLIFLRSRAPRRGIRARRWR